MFRSYARFGVVVQLMAALLAGIGVDYLRRAGTQARADRVRRARGARRRRVRRLAVGAVARRAARRRRTAGSMQQADRVRVLDCTPLNQESASVQWLTGDRVTLLGGAIERLHRAEPAAEACGDWLHAPARAARHAPTDNGSPSTPAPDGLARRRALRRRTGVRGHGADAGDLYRSDDRVLSARARCGVDVAMDGSRRGVDDREHQRAADRRDARPRAVGVPPCRAAWSCGSTGSRVQTLVVEPSRRIYQIGPLTVAPGDHELVVSSG